MVGRPHRLMLVDNEPTISLNPLPARITEGEVLTVTARLNHASNVDVQVSLQFEAWTLDLPEYQRESARRRSRDIDSADYTLSPPTATIPAGELTAIFNLMAIDDPDYPKGNPDYEGYEYGRLRLNAIGAGVVDDPPILALADNHPAISLDSLPERVTEGETLEVTVRLSRVTEFTATVRPYFLSNYGTNFDSEDYTFSSPLVTIPAGELTATFTISIKDDLDYEYEQTIFLFLDLEGNWPYDVFERDLRRSFIFVDNDVDTPILSLNPVAQRGHRRRPGAVSCAPGACGGS